MGGSNEKYEVNHQTYCGSMERWTLKPIYTTYISGIYTLTNLDKNVQPANINGSEITLSATQGDQWVIEMMVSSCMPVPRMAWRMLWCFMPSNANSMSWSVINNSWLIHIVE